VSPGLNPTNNPVFDTVLKVKAFATEGVKVYVYDVAAPPVQLTLNPVDVMAVAGASTGATGATGARAVTGGNIVGVADEARGVVVTFIVF